MSIDLAVVLSRWIDLETMKRLDELETDKSKVDKTCGVQLYQNRTRQFRNNR